MIYQSRNKKIHHLQEILYKVTEAEYMKDDTKIKIEHCMSTGKQLIDAHVRNDKIEDVENIKKEYPYLFADDVGLVGYITLTIENRMNQFSLKKFTNFIVNGLSSLITTFYEGKTEKSIFDRNEQFENELNMVAMYDNNFNNDIFCRIADIVEQKEKEARKTFLQPNEEESLEIHDQIDEDLYVDLEQIS